MAIESDIYITYGVLKRDFSHFHFNKYMNMIPSFMREKIGNIMIYHNQCLSLLGKILLLNMLNTLGDDFNLENIQYTRYNKPFFSGNLFFNISHSNECVVCAMSKVYPLGIDVEMIRPINFLHFTSVLNCDDLNLLLESDDCNNSFFELWTAKEALSKLLGLGLGLSFDRIRMYKNYMKYNDRLFKYHYIKISDQYKCCLVFEDINNTREPQIKIREFYCS